MLSKMAEIAFRGFVSGYPSYEVVGEYAPYPEQEVIPEAICVELVGEDTPTAHRSLGFSAPGGIADRSTGAGSVELVAMVLAKERPAVQIEIFEGMFSASDLEALKLAGDKGLCIVRFTVPWTTEDSFLIVGHNQEAAMRAVEAHLLNPRSLDFDIVFGRAIGYSEEDIRAFCIHSIRLCYPSLDAEAECKAAFSRVGPRPEDLSWAASPEVDTDPSMPSL